ncbi:zinc-binding alcohol dehydrogenase family protein [Streptomyces sp. NPDC093085]|uniref:quinone oxidoreductase family protein n=1 Tax=Streptomyces sp. NPDC093085 TaxID=3155068 RepID=UPI00343805E6
MKINAASLNPVDLHIAAGRFFDGPPQVPYVPGLEGVGVVERSTSLAPGTRVRVAIIHPGYGRDGALAEYVFIPEKPDAASQAQLSVIKGALGDIAIAAIGGPGSTALSLLDRVRQVGSTVEGATVLVMAATGAVGTLAVQIAKRLGAVRVIAAGRDRSRLEPLAELGADALVRLGDDEEALRRSLVEASDGRLDVVLEPLWGMPARAAVHALRTDGVLINFGGVAAFETPMSAQPLRNKRVRPAGHSGAWTTRAQRITTFRRLLDMAEDAPLALPVQEVSIDDVPTAWPRVAAGAGGKFVVRMS